jgi:hypothetical protein
VLNTERNPTGRSVCDIDLIALPKHLLASRAIAFLKQAIALLGLEQRSWWFWRAIALSVEMMIAFV